MNDYVVTQEGVINLTPLVQLKALPSEEKDGDKERKGADAVPVPLWKAREILLKAVESGAGRGLFGKECFSRPRQCCSTACRRATSVSDGNGDSDGVQVFSIRLEVRKGGFKNALASGWEGRWAGNL